MGDTAIETRPANPKLRLIAEEASERYEYVPASMKVIQDVCLKYACHCTERIATEPQQPIRRARPARVYWRK
jgi:transposase